MKRIPAFVLALLLAVSLNPGESDAQALELIGGNTLNGAVTGAALGAATMSLNDSDDFKYLQTGLGAGILGGAAIAIYDIVTLPQGQQFYITGTLNDGYNSSIIILLDTVYGAATGGILGAGITLIADRPILEGVRYGASIGAWAGFGFGLIDSFVLAGRNRDLMSSSAGFLNREAVVVMNHGSGSSVGLLRPSAIGMKNMSGGDLILQVEPVLDLVSWRLSF